MTLKEICDRLDYTKTYRVTFYGLIEDCGSWSVNQPWRGCIDATKKEVKEHLRCRLLVFRENYLKPKRQKVTFEDVGFAKEYLELECNGMPFAHIEEN